MNVCTDIYGINSKKKIEMQGCTIRTQCLIQCNVKHYKRLPISIINMQKISKFYKAWICPVASVLALLNLFNFMFIFCLFLWVISNNGSIWLWVNSPLFKLFSWLSATRPVEVFKCKHRSRHLRNGVGDKHMLKYRPHIQARPSLHPSQHRRNHQVKHGEVKHRLRSEHPASQCRGVG